MNQLSGTTANLVTALLIHYSFDLGGYTSRELIAQWFNNYPAKWVRAAVIEALYRGRYKAISVDQILAVWQRRGDALHHFTHEFERLVCADLPDTLIEQIESMDNTIQHEPKMLVASSSREQDSSVIVINSTTVKPAMSNSTSEVRSPTSSSYSPIVRFTPPNTSTSDFHAKLKAISRMTKTKQSDSELSS